MHSSILSPAVTGIASGIIPDAVEPIAIAANAGVNNRGAPCTVNVLLAQLIFVSALEQVIMEIMHLKKPDDNTCAWCYKCIITYT